MAAMDPKAASSPELPPVTPDHSIPPTSAALHIARHGSNQLTRGSRPPEAPIWRETLLLPVGHLRGDLGDHRHGALPIGIDRGRSSFVGLLQGLVDPLLDDFGPQPQQPILDVDVGEQMVPR